jgi:hypothetical protein
LSISLFLIFAKKFRLRKIVAIFLGFLILYNIAGYLIVFKSFQFAIRNEIRTKIENHDADNDLVTIKLTNNNIRSGLNGFKWLDKNEFTLDGKLYDVVQCKVEGDTYILYCINDTKEEQLNANLNFHEKCLTDQNIPLREKSNTLFQFIIKQALLNKLNRNLQNESFFRYSFLNIPLPVYFQKEIPCPPPKDFI